MRLADWMTAPVLTVAPSTPIAACGRLAHDRRVRHLPVVDAAGRCTGVVTDFELRPRGRMVDGRWVSRVPGEEWVAGQLAREAELRFAPADRLERVLTHLGDAPQDFVLAEEGDRLVGILTEHDVVRFAVDRPAPLLPPRRGLPLVEAELPAVEARSLLARRREPHGLVVREGRLVGVLSLRDVAVAELVDEGVTAAQAASLPIAVVDGPEWDVARIATFLHDRKIGCLPLVDADGRPVRLVSRQTLVRAVAAALRA